MKYLYLILTIIFLLFAVVQLNDPDPVIWFGAYFLVAVFCFLAFRKRYYPIPTLVFFVLTFIWAIILFPPGFHDWWQLEEEAQSLKMKMPGIEEARESMGLLISTVTLFFIWLRGRKAIKTTE